MDGGTRCRWGQGRAKAIIFSMATEFLNACLIFFVPAIVVACIIDHEEAGALIILAAAVVVAASDDDDDEVPEAAYVQVPGSDDES